MKILFDLQEYLADKPLGELAGDKIICPCGEVPPALIVEQVEDAKVIRVTNRKSKDAGVEIFLSSIGGISAGDRFTLVGRQQLTSHGARIALSTSINRDKELAHYEPHNNLYSLSFSLDDQACQSVFLLVTKTGAFFSSMDFFVDGILIVHH